MKPSLYIVKLYTYAMVTFMLQSGSMYAERVKPLDDPSGVSIQK